MKTPNSSAPLGFSLIEVVVALGIFSFCVVAIVGLLSVAMGSTRSVLNEGTAGAIADSIFDAWAVQENGTASLTVVNLFTNLPALSSAANEDFFFNDVGQQVELPEEASFKIGYQVLPLDNPGVVASSLELVVSWPVNGAPNAMQTRGFTRVFVK
jgi:uncharacterized protein (TIGR02598 family)